MRVREWIRERWDYFLVALIAAIAIAALVFGIMVKLGHADEITELRAELDLVKEQKVRLETYLSGNISQLRAEQDLRWEAFLRPPELNVERGVKIPGSDEWTQELTAKTGQRLELMVKISSTGVAHNVWVKAELPQLLYYRDTLKVDGVAFFGSVTDGINIGTVTSCTERVVTFEVQTATATQFKVGTTTLVVPIKVWADCVVLDSGDITIIVERAPPAPSGGGRSRPRPPDTCPGGPGDDPPPRQPDTCSGGPGNDPTPRQPGGPSDEPGPGG